MFAINYKLILRVFLGILGGAALLFFLTKPLSVTVEDSRSANAVIIKTDVLTVQPVTNTIIKSKDEVKDTNELKVNMGHD